MTLTNAPDDLIEIDQSAYSRLLSNIVSQEQLQETTQQPSNTQSPALKTVDTLNSISLLDSINNQSFSLESDESIGQI